MNQPKQSQVTQLKVAPQPLPMTVDVTQQPMSDGSIAVRLDISDPGGCKVTIMPADLARQLGEMLVQASGTAKTGLIIAGNGNLPMKNIEGNHGH